MATKAGATTPSRRHRPYDNSRRRQKAAETRRRIVQAGSELLHSSDVRDFESLTVRAVAERAGVNERTVYRHFDNERGLRDAVMHRLEDEAGVELEGLRIDDIGALGARIFRHAASYRLKAPLPLDPTLSETRRRLHGALVEAVAGSAPQWSEDDQVMAAAVLELLTSVGAYERLVGDWGLDTTHAVTAAGWVISLVEDAVRQGPGPVDRPGHVPGA